jgi:hypothetical protein
MPSKGLKIAIDWKVEDGYINNGPHSTSFYADEFFSGDSREEVIEQIERIVQEDFDVSVSPSYDHSDVEKAADEILTYLRNKYGENDE